MFAFELKNCNIFVKSGMVEERNNDSLLLLVDDRIRFNGVVCVVVVIWVDCSLKFEENTRISRFFRLPPPPPQQQPKNFNKSKFFYNFLCFFVFHDSSVSRNFWKGNQRKIFKKIENI